MLENVKPYGNRIIVKKQDIKDEKFGSVFIADSGGEKPIKATVVATGVGAYNFGTFVPVTTLVGETVIVPKAGALKIKIENIEYLIIEEHHLLLNLGK